MRFRLTTVLAILALGAAAGCGSDDDGGGGSGGGDGAKKSVIYVSTNPLGTNQFLNLIADGAKAGGEECGATVKVVQSNDPNQLAANLRAAVQAKPDLIVANSFDSVETITGLVKQRRTRSGRWSTPPSRTRRTCAGSSSRRTRACT